MKKQLRLGVQYSSYFKSSRGEKVYDWGKINEHVTKFYRELYDCKNVREVEERRDRRFQDEPEFMPEEIRQVTKDLENNKNPGHNKITNEHIKLGGSTGKLPNELI